MHLMRLTLFCLCGKLLMLIKALISWFLVANPYPYMWSMWWFLVANIFPYVVYIVVPGCQYLPICGSCGGSWLPMPTPMLFKRLFRVDDTYPYVVHVVRVALEGVWRGCDTLRLCRVLPVLPLLCVNSTVAPVCAEREKPEILVIKVWMWTWSM